MPITPSGEYSDGGTALTTLSVTTTGVGNLQVLYITSEPNGALVASVSSSNVATWENASSYEDSIGVYTAIWWGVVTATGSDTVTISGTDLDGASYNTLWSREFSDDATSYVWSLLTASPGANSSGGIMETGTSISYPSLADTGSTGDNLYVGGVQSIYGGMTAGSDSGYTYDSITDGSSDQAVFNEAFTGTGGPSATTDNAGGYDAVAAIFTATPSSGHRAIVVYGPNASAVTLGGSYVYITYSIFDDTGLINTAASGGAGAVTQITFSLTYEDVANLQEAITAAVRDSESDPTLEVYFT